MKYKIVGIFVLTVIAAQFIPYGKDHVNPSIVAEPTWDRPKTKELFSRACGDCHSNETKWPWYSSIAPTSWLIQHDINEGRGDFNVSMWGVQKKNEGTKAAEEVKKGDMPLWFYLIPHPEARLSDNEKNELIHGLVATFGTKTGK
jgi:hypothetical protein